MSPRNTSASVTVAAKMGIEYDWIEVSLELASVSVTKLWIGLMFNSCELLSDLKKSLRHHRQVPGCVLDAITVALHEIRASKLSTL